GPHQAWGQYENGGLHMNVGGLRNIDPAKSPTDVHSGGAQDVFRLTTHEYFHELQGVWARERPKSSPLANVGYVSESMAVSVECSLCLNNFPNAASPGDCVSTIKIRATPEHCRIFSG